MKLLATAAAIVAALAIIGMSGGNKPSSAQQRAAMRDVDAITYCKLQEKRELVAPASARFGGWKVTRGDTYVVTGHVDAQNSLGAMLRKPVRCAFPKAKLAAFSECADGAAASCSRI